MTPTLWQFVALLAVHWVGDFFLQSHWMASNKSSDNLALSAHVGMYTLTLWVGAAVIFLGQSPEKWVAFALVNGLLHFGTDYFTSRTTARLWKEQRVHDFFVVIGMDQLIHQVTLAATMWWVFA